MCIAAVWHCCDGVSSSQHVAGAVAADAVVAAEGMAVTDDGHNLCIFRMHNCILKCAYGSRLLVYLWLVRQVSIVHVSGKLVAASGDRGCHLT